MESGYYSSGPERSQRVRTLFNRIAARYDLINDVQSFGLHRVWKRKVLEKAEVQPGEEALDVCCGTGDLAFGLSRAGAKATGCDFSGAMLEKARERNRSRINLVQGDALRLPFRSSSFAIITIGYGLRNLADMPGGLTELVRVLKPGGRLLILDFGKPRNRTWRAAYFAYLRLFVPLFGVIFCGDRAAYSYILESLQHYPAQEGVAELLRRAGCIEIRLDNLAGGVMSIHRAVKPLLTSPAQRCTVENGAFPGPA